MAYSEPSDRAPEEAIPLLSHALPSAVVAYRQGIPIDAHCFLGDATRLAERLPIGKHVLNACLDRYRFTVGLAACLMTGRVSLLPPTQAPDVIRQLSTWAPDAFCLTDEQDCTIALPRFLYPAPPPGAAFAPHGEGPWRVPRIPKSQLAAIVFTSGSTGAPLPYQKTWGKLAHCVRDGAPRLGLLDGRAHTLIGTVPAQHMYGFESSVLLALLSGNAFVAERPFYPADICATLDAVPRPRTLISTPVHLRTLLAAGTPLPPVDLVMSATAPLDALFAAEVEARMQTRLLEIYGSTETGQIAMRRTAAAPAWRLWPNVRLTASNGEVLAHGGHVEQVTPLGDVIEITSEEEFLLHGRSADSVNVAGKRSSFGYLNAHLNALPGVLDGAFFLRDPPAESRTGVARLAAVVVAPGRSARQLTLQLRQRIDPAFLPRPLLLVDRLPRNATGKLPRDALRAFAESRLSSSAAVRTDLAIAREHESFSGHFPGMPILPGAVLLDEALHALECSRGIDPLRWQVASAKFLEVVRPGDALILEHSRPDARTIRFVIRAASGEVARCTLSAMTEDAARGS